jgi:hypothetical protein
MQTDAPATLDDLVVRVPWFSRGQWKAMVTAANGSLCREESYAQWRRKAGENIASIHRAGIRTCKVEVNTQAFVLWCRARSKVLNTTSLAEYISRCPNK